MRLALLSLSALALAACGGEAPAAPAAPTPAAEAPAAETHAGHGPMDADMQSADAADDANTAETPDGFMFHTDTSKIESVHLPNTPGFMWTTTIEDLSQVELVEAADAKMPDGADHHVVKLKPLKSGVITKVTFERHEGTINGAIAETRTVQVMIH